jgi:hypothetical protein
MCTYGNLGLGVTTSRLVWALIQVIEIKDKIRPTGEHPEGRSGVSSPEPEQEWQGQMPRGQRPKGQRQESLKQKYT